MCHLAENPSSLPSLAFIRRLFLMSIETETKGEIQGIENLLAEFRADAAKIDLSTLDNLHCEQTFKYETTELEKKRKRYTEYIDKQKMCRIVLFHVQSPPSLPSLTFPPIPIFTFQNHAYTYSSKGIVGFPTTLFKIVTEKDKLEDKDDVLTVNAEHLWESPTQHRVDEACHQLDSLLNRWHNDQFRPGEVERTPEDLMIKLAVHMCGHEQGTIVSREFDHPDRRRAAEQCSVNWHDDPHVRDIPVSLLPRPGLGEEKLRAHAMPSLWVNSEKGEWWKQIADQLRELESRGLPEELLTYKVFKSRGVITRVLGSLIEVLERSRGDESVPASEVGGPAMKDILSVFLPMTKIEGHIAMLATSLLALMVLYVPDPRFFVWSKKSPNAMLDRYVELLSSICGDIDRPDYALLNSRRLAMLRNIVGTCPTGGISFGREQLAALFQRGSPAQARDLPPVVWAQAVSLVYNNYFRSENSEDVLVLVSMAFRAHRLIGSKGGAGSSPADPSSAIENHQAMFLLCSLASRAIDSAPLDAVQETAITFQSWRRANRTFAPTSFSWVGVVERLCWNRLDQ
eukprot:gnl/Dysnectes_brevis/63_a79_4545.p1 GENE.gnl/Dysnectes_brevis/63_a79_4545~~gnl/Dysnectes_brevis/63_a79_4545.p1  ORF type:complete len:570 (-),score=173.22 gnl/Dysnectes_brevis/63_a79_4545:53-1762(-)